MVGQAGSARRQARRARLRLAVLAGAFLTYWGCASTGDPPGGPPRSTPPVLLATIPESGAVLETPPRRVELDFDEVIGERIAAPQPTLAGAVLVSPVTKPVSVGWHRDHITVSVKGGFAPGRIYRVDLLPVIVDLHQNRLKKGRTIVFSTGPAIPATTLSGTVVDWTAGHAAATALVRAVLLPDSLPYLAQTDSVGNFTLTEVPQGQYLVWGILDQNNNRKLDPREGFDTARVALTDTATVGLYAFTHDTIGPRLRSADFVDSVTVRLTFDRPVGNDVPVDTSMVTVTPMSDSTAPLPLLRVWTPAAFDSVSKAEAAARAAERAAKDSAARAQAAARDTTHRRAAPVGPPRPAGAPPPLGPGTRRDTTAARRDTSNAAKLLAKRPAPSDTRVVRLGAPLEPGTRYLVLTRGVIGLTGVAGRGRTTFSAPKPPPRRPAPGTADSLSRVRGDTAVARPDTVTVRPDTAAARPDTVRVRPDTSAARHDTTPAPATPRPRSR